MRKWVALCFAVAGLGTCFVAKDALAGTKTVNSALRLAAAWLERGQRTPRPTLKEPSRRSLSRGGGGEVAVRRRVAKVVEERKLPVDSPVVALAELDGSLWLGTFDEGLFRDEAKVPDVDERVNDLTADGANRRLFVATNGGAYEVTATTAGPGSAVRRLSRGAFTATALWRGEAWFTSRQGVSVLTPAGLWTRGPAQGMGADAPAALADCGAQLCVGAVDGLWLYDGERAVHRSSADDTLPSDWVTAVAYADGTTWAGTFDAGLARVGVRRYAPEDGLPEGRVQPHGLAVSGGFAVAATPLGLLLVSETEEVSLVVEGLPARELTSVLPSAYGGVWVGYRGGASRIVWFEEERS